MYTHVLPPCVAPSCAQYTDKMVETCILVYNTIITQLLPTPAKSHYTFNLRDLSKVFQGMLMMEQGKIEVHPQSLQTSSVEILNTYKWICVISLWFQYKLVCSFDIEIWKGNCENCDDKKHVIHISNIDLSS